MIEQLRNTPVRKLVHALEEMDLNIVAGRVVSASTGILTVDALLYTITEQTTCCLLAPSDNSSKAPAGQEMTYIDLV